MSKNIVICYDGTGNEYGKNNTNVVGVYESIIHDKNQIAFYDPGVGTINVLGRTYGKKAGIILGKAFGYGLQQNIEEGYEYLMDYYEPDDRIFLFGFSRGAFTARALAGLLNRFGLLFKGSRNLIPYVSKNYIEHKFEAAEGFKRTLCQNCKPYFIGVWDTVGSLGYIVGKKFFDTKLNDDINFGYQAIAIDEKRKKFDVSLWNENNIGANQTIEQVYFAGVHSDVGGWYDERHLSDIAFAWMMDKAAECDLRLKPDWQKRLDQHAAGKIHESRTGLWKVWPPFNRLIPEGAKIHQSVLDRIEKRNDYHPTLPQKYETVSNQTYNQ